MKVRNSRVYVAVCGMLVNLHCLAFRIETGDELYITSLRFAVRHSRLGDSLESTSLKFWTSPLWSVSRLSVRSLGRRV